MFLRWCLVVELGVLISCVLALAQPINTRKGDNLEELNNHRGQTPCTLNDEIASSCQSQRALKTRDDTITPPTPSACTCNNVFFNLWSACLILHGNATLPVFDDWGSQCRDSSLDLTAGNPDKDNANIPSWAFANVSGSSTFDVNAALSNAKKKGWTTVQIVVPVVVGVGVLVAALFGVFLYRRRSRKQSWPAILRHLRLRPRVYNVRKASRSGPWTIDRAEDAEEYFAVDNGEGTSSHRTSKGHTRLSSSSTVGDQSSPDNVQYELPLRSRIAHQLRTLPDHFTLPWRVRAIEVRNKPPRQGFRVDSWDVSTLSSPSTVSGAHSRSAPTESSRVGRNQLHDTILEEDEADVQSSLNFNTDREENSVLFIGHRSGNLTVESGSSSSKPQSVQVVPPSPTVSSHASALHRTQQPLSPTTRTQIPPTPTQPAPLPPSFLRHNMSQPVEGLFQTERASRLVQPITPPISRPHSPIVRYNSPDNVIRSPVNVQHTLPRMSSPVYHSRQLPVAPNIQRNVSPSRPVVGRGLASSSSIESLYIDIRSPSSHQRSSSDLRLTKAQFDPLMMSPPITPGLPLEDEQTRRHQISSLSSSSLHPSRSSSPHHRSLTPTLLSPRHRGAGDSTVTLETLYSLDDAYHGAHSLNVSDSIFPDRGDPVMLFPGSVRAAGYAPHSPTTATYYDGGI